jgi:hypothetical protein
LINPLDNDAEARDQDPNATVVMLPSAELENFSLLLDGTAWESTRRRSRRWP